MLSLEEEIIVYLWVPLMYLSANGDRDRRCVDSMCLYLLTLGRSSPNVQISCVGDLSQRRRDGVISASHSPPRTVLSLLVSYSVLLYSYNTALREHDGNQFRSFRTKKKIKLSFSFGAARDAWLLAWDGRYRQPYSVVQRSCASDGFLSSVRRKWNKILRASYVSTWDGWLKGLNNGINDSTDVKSGRTKDARSLSYRTFLAQIDTFADVCEFCISVSCDLKTRYLLTFSLRPRNQDRARVSPSLEPVTEVYTCAWCFRKYPRNGTDEVGKADHWW